MNTGFYKFLDVEREERARVNLLLGQSLFLGIFYGTLDISAHALFLSEYSEETLPVAFLISGSVGIILTAVYTRLQSVLSFSRLSIRNLLFIAVIMVALWLGFTYVELKTWVFVVFVMMGPLNILALIGFGGTTNRLFSLREGKRLFGLVDAGQILGIIISSYAIPFILNAGITTTDLLLFSAMSVMVAFLFQLIIVRRFREKEEPQDEVVAAEPPKRNRFTDLFKDSYTLVLASFVGFSVIVAFLVHYLFVAVTNAQFPENTKFAQFFGYFMGTLMVFTLLFKTFVFSRLMKTYGLKLSLLISPVLIALFSVGAAIIGGFFGYTTAAAGFTFFFLLVALTKLFSKSLKDSIEAPSFKILYLSLDKKIRYDIQARVDGTVNEISAVAAGLIMTGLTALAFVKLIHFNYLLVFFVVIWLFFAFRLYRLYQNALRESLVGIKDPGQVDETAKTAQELWADKVIGGMDLADFRTSYKILNKWLPFQTERYIARLFQSLKPEDQVGAGTHIADHFDLDAYHAFKNLTSGGDVNSKSAAWFLELQREFEKISGEWEKNTVADGLKIPDATLKLKVIRIFRFRSVEFSSMEIHALLREADPRLKNEAILIAGYQKTIELIPSLIDLLSSPHHYSYAFGALLEMGEDGLNMLEQSFYKTGLKTNALKRIVRIMGLIGGEKATSYLSGKIDYHLRPVVLEVIKALKTAHYQADDESRSRFYRIIEQAVGIVGWNLSANASIRKEEISGELIKALEDEMQESYDFLYELLSITFESQTIIHIRKNLEHGSAEGVSFALELLDLVIDEEIKPVLLPVLNDTSDEDKLKELQNFFPLERMNTQALLIAILNRDYNYLSLWTKVCALRNYSELNTTELPNDLLAQIFHPDPVLRETATILAMHIDKQKLTETMRRIPFDIRRDLENSLRDSKERPFVLEEKKILNLKGTRHFKSIKGHCLFPMAADIKVITVEQDEKYKPEIWDRTFDAFMVVQGPCRLFDGPEPVMKISGPQSFSFGADNTDPVLALPSNAPAPAVIYHIKGDRVLEHFFDDPQNLYLYCKNVSSYHSMDSATEEEHPGEDKKQDHI